MIKRPTTILKRRYGTRIMPDNLRIPFKKVRPYNDKQVFELYATGALDAETGAFYVGQNNDTHVSAEQFIANAEWLGYTDEE